MAYRRKIAEVENLDAKQEEIEVEPRQLGARTRLHRSSRSAVRPCRWCAGCRTVCASGAGPSARHSSCQRSLRQAGPLSVITCSTARPRLAHQRTARRRKATVCSARFEGGASAQASASDRPRRCAGMPAGTGAERARVGQDHLVGLVEAVQILDVDVQQLASPARVRSAAPAASKPVSGTRCRTAAAPADGRGRCRPAPPAVHGQAARFLPAGCLRDARPASARRTARSLVSIEWRICSPAPPPPASGTPWGGISFNTSLVGGPHPISCPEPLWF